MNTIDFSTIIFHCHWGIIVPYFSIIGSDLNFEHLIDISKIKAVRTP